MGNTTSQRSCVEPRFCRDEWSSLGALAQFPHEPRAEGIGPKPPPYGGFCSSGVRDTPSCYQCIKGETGLAGQLHIGAMVASREKGGTSFCGGQEAYMKKLMMVVVIGLALATMGFAQGRGGGGGHFSGGSGGHSYSGGGHFTGGGHSYTGGGSFSSGARGYSGHFSGGTARGSFNGGFRGYRGGYGYGRGFGFGFSYAPGYYSYADPYYVDPYAYAPAYYPPVVGGVVIGGGGYWRGYRGGRGFAGGGWRGYRR